MKSGDNTSDEDDDVALFLLKTGESEEVTLTPFIPGRLFKLEDGERTEAVEVVAVVVVAIMGD